MLKQSNCDIIHCILLFGLNSTNKTRGSSFLMYNFSLDKQIQIQKESFAEFMSTWWKMLSHCFFRTRINRIFMFTKPLHSSTRCLTNILWRVTFTSSVRLETCYTMNNIFRNTSQTRRNVMLAVHPTSILVTSLWVKISSMKKILIGWRTVSCKYNIYNMLFCKKCKVN